MKLKYVKNEDIAKYLVYHGEYIITEIDITYNAYHRRDVYMVDGKGFLYLKDAKNYIENRLN